MRVGQLHLPPRVLPPAHLGLGVPHDDHRERVLVSSPSNRLRHGEHSHHRGESPGLMDGCRTKLSRQRPQRVTASPDSFSSSSTSGMGDAMAASGG
jgi:hypothetical protein